MSDQRPDTGTSDHHHYPARDGGDLCQDEDCKPETACLDDDCCKDDEDCHAANPCAEDHSHPHVVAARADDNASVNSKASTCCGSVERCDEKCIYTAAQIECAKACEGEGDDEGNVATIRLPSYTHKKHPHEHNAAGDHLDTACTSHLTAAFEKYASYIEQAKCICRTMVSNGLSSSSACCKPAAPPVMKATTASVTTTSPTASGWQTSNRDGMSTG
ncbi:unnamed protein product [Clonostachys rosea]|uniref:Extracellular membrane protein CFEM domain-containing protein n=1 Tax=Bionectria ochroleuca TaxID=29856 RepID=A0ABY6UP87_BIOOC|nr:unnamed protein product [Clonostachys rosea]